MTVINKLIKFIHNKLSDVDVSAHDTCKDISKKSISHLIENRIKYPDALSIGKKILKMEAQNERFEYINSIGGNHILSKILLNRNYYYEDGYIICKKFLHVRIIIHNKRIYFLNNDQIEKLYNMGIGIRQFKFLFAPILHDVLCEGIHLNMDPCSGNFCIDDGIKGKIISEKLIRSVEYMLVQMNLDQSYYYDGGIKQKIERVLNER